MPDDAVPVPVYCDHCGVAEEIAAPRSMLASGFWAPPPCAECGHDRSIDLDNVSLDDLIGD